MTNEFITYSPEEITVDDELITEIKPVPSSVMTIELRTPQQDFKGLDTVIVKFSCGSEMVLTKP